ncbi:hypothetical protein Oscil6304_2397 [Oscillatoria acuminata PCC 6304]|uniref:Uncharacterized protein n=1 Tax=Oscillatoria acuminata PCC 6304 TaxID=56110 RepID=K9TIN8_9CYAN|nr:hypothetical protein Oscil6304_2397 [Oscillatoria acuminata PCC 6304]
MRRFTFVPHIASLSRSFPGVSGTRWDLYPGLLIPEFASLRNRVLESPDGLGGRIFTFMCSKRRVALSSLPHPLGQLPSFSFLSILADSCQNRWEICFSDDSQTREFRAKQQTIVKIITPGDVTCLGVKCNRGDHQWEPRGETIR